jgi:hypothetical protein
MSPDLMVKSSWIKSESPAVCRAFSLKFKVIRCVKGFDLKMRFAAPVLSSDSAVDEQAGTRSQSKPD